MPTDPYRANRQLERQFGGRPLKGCLDNRDESPEKVIAADKISAEVRAEWDSFPWYKKIWIRLWPSLYPEWHF